MSSTPPPSCQPQSQEARSQQQCRRWHWHWCPSTESLRISKANRPAVPEEVLSPGAWSPPRKLDRGSAGVDLRSRPVGALNIGKRSLGTCLVGSVRAWQLEIEAFQMTQRRQNEIIETHQHQAVREHFLAGP